MLESELPQAHQTCDPHLTTGLGFSIAVVAHVARGDEAWDLAEDVGADYITYDDGSRGATANHLRAWKWHAGNVNGATSWNLVMEDDAIAVPDFRSQLREALAVAPADVVSLYLGRLNPPHWQARIQRTVESANHLNASWIVCREMLHGVGIAVRSHLVPGLLDFVDANPGYPIDEAVSVWCQREGRKVAYAWPSPLDHADGPSLIDHPGPITERKPGRKAWEFGSRTTWNAMSVNL